MSVLWVTTGAMRAFKNRHQTPNRAGYHWTYSTAEPYSNRVAMAASDDARAEGGTIKMFSTLERPVLLFPVSSDRACSMPASLQRPPRPAVPSFAALPRVARCVAAPKRGVNRPAQTRS